MQRILLVVLLLGIAVVGLGFYQGWFQVGSGEADGKSNITLSVDKDKFEEDREKAVASVRDVVGRGKDKVTGKGATTVDGKLVSVDLSKLDMTDKEGKEHSHVLAPNVQVSCDGKECTTADLKAGMRIRVTTDAKDRHVVTHIEALDTADTFASGRDAPKAVNVDRPE